MSTPCTLCAVLNGDIDANDVPLAFLHASSARMVTHFIMHPSIDQARSIEKLFSLIGSHVGLEADPHGVRHYADIVNKWREIIATASECGTARQRGPRKLH